MIKDFLENSDANSKKRLLKAMVAFLVPVFVVVLWEFAARTGHLPTSILSAPSKIIRATFRLSMSLEIFRHSGVSLARLVAGLIIGSFFGSAVGLWVGVQRRASKLLEPTLSYLVPIPGLAWIPLLIIFFGIGELTKVLLIAVGSFFVLFLQTLDAVRNVDQHLVEVGHAFHKSPWAILTNIVLPSCVPSIFTGLKVALALSWTLLLGSEMIASSSGLGFLLWDSRNFGRADEMFAGMIAIAVLGKATQGVLNRWQEKSLNWRSSFKTFDA